MASDILWSRYGTARKGFLSGSHRIIAPSETIAKVAPLMPVFGITRVANVTGLDNLGIPVVMVCRPNARSLSVSQGKGPDLASAKASGLMESIEAFHAEHITLPLKLATYNELRFTHTLVDVDKLPRLSSNRFHADLRVLWIEGFDLLQNTSVWLPYELVHMDYTIPFPAGCGCFVNSSNGLAAGNHILEAISHGICEVIERDALTLWRTKNAYPRGSGRIDLSTIDDHACRGLLQRFADASVFAAVWEITSDTLVPCFYCAIFDNDPNSWRASYVCAGSGCHSDRRVALLRALTEAAQSRLTIIAGSRDDLTLSGYMGAGNSANSKALRETPPSRSFLDAPTFQCERFDQEVRWLLDRLHSVNCHSVAVVDLAKSNICIDVVRVVIPGMEPPSDIPGYVPGVRALSLAQSR
jgi:YcaO-like protein with predicted kinase domain